MLKNKQNKKAMSIIEVMIAIFVFTLGITSIFMIINSTSNVNIFNKNFIIASNLAKEQIELIRNIRDTNYKRFQKWNMLNPKTIYYTQVFKEGSFYKIENNNEGLDFHIKSSTGSEVSDFKKEILDNSPIIEEYRLCIDSSERYVYCGTNNSNLKKTSFYKYIEIKEILDSNQRKIENSYKINSKVYWNIKGVHKVEIPTILADYKRL